MTQDGRIRIAHVVCQLDMGGMEKLLVEFARYADRERFDLRFLSLGKRGILAEDIEDCGWPVTALEEPAGLRPQLVFRLAKLFHREQIDVVHTHNTKPLLYAGPAACLARTPRLIHTRHGQRFQARRRQNIAFRLATHAAEKVVCISRDSARLSLAEGIAPQRVCTIWNGIDVTRFRFRGPCLDGPALMVGRLSPEKNVETLLQAAAIVIKEKPSFRLEIAGDGECLSSLQHVNRALGLERHVRFLGQVRDIPNLMARASVFVLPSLTEGISLTLLEAMATGLPVVATRVGGNPEVILHETTGLLVPARSPEAFAAGLLRLLREPDVSRNMGRAGRCQVETHFDVRRMVAAYETLYHKVLGRQRDPCGMEKTLPLENAEPVMP